MCERVERERQRAIERERHEANEQPEQHEQEEEAPRLDDWHVSHMEHGREAEELLHDRRRRHACRDRAHEHERREIFREFLEAEDHARERRVERRREARARAGRQEIAILARRPPRHAPDALSEARAELHARPFTAKRQSRADAEHGADEFPREHARPVHLHLAREDALDLRDARPRRHRLMAHDAVEHVADSGEHGAPCRRPHGRCRRKPRIEARQRLLRQHEEIAERRDHEARQHADEIPFEEQPQLHALWCREPVEQRDDVLPHAEPSFFVYRKRLPRRGASCSRDYSAVNGSSAMLRARLIATVTWR